MSRILGLDVGRSIGWAVYEPAADVQICCTAPLMGDDIGAQVSAFRAWLRATIEGHRPTLLSMERPFGRAVATVLPEVLVATAHSVAHDMMLPRCEFTASALKKAIAGNGRASKADVIAAVRRLGWTPDTDHAADAAACAVAALARAKQ